MPKTRRIKSDSCSVGELLRRPFSYKVPFYQRDFSWKEEEVSNLWHDLTNALEKGTQDYFLGAIVLTEPGDNKIQEIVDGQQRLAVLSMIMSAIANYWRDKSDEKRATGVFGDYLGIEDRRTGEIVPKLTLNEINDPTFQSLVIRREKDEIQKKTWQKLTSNRLVYEASDNIDASLKTWVDKYDDKDSLVLDIEEFIRDNTSLILIEVENDRDAFVIFETLNDRGLDLAVSDLIKTYLFSLAESGQINNFKQIWRDISLLVGGSVMTQFLRHYWNSLYGLVREKELYAELKDAIKSGTKARQFMEQLRKTAELYNALSNTEHPYWSDFDIEVKHYIETLVTFGVVQYKPLALAIMENAEPEFVTRVLRALVIISLRYNIISGLRTGDLERVYSEAAVSVRDGKVSNIKGLFQLLRPIYVQDLNFIEAFSTARISKAGVARYILAELNDRIENDNEKKVALKSGKITLEHILPKNPGANWKGSYEDRDDLQEHVDYIGNLTLLEEGKNKGISNLGFADKKNVAYETSSLAINRRVSEHHSWTTKDIRLRSKELANTAKDIWRIDV